MRIADGFQQPLIVPEHPYSSDPVLPSLIKRLLPNSTLLDVEKDLVRLGHTLIDDIRPLATLVQPPTLTQYDSWGRRIDRLETSEGWRLLEAWAVKEGYVGNAYERKYQEHSRTYMFAKCMLMTGDFHVIMCPFGMTDGAARVIELHGTKRMKKEIFPRLTSRDPSSSYLCGQWMTERPGGSDVSRTETSATPTSTTGDDLGPAYVLEGFKWFSSAGEGNAALALARTGDIADGSKSLSLFLVPLRHTPFPTPLSNGIEIHRLKNKIGTHGVPTAELSLNSTRGWLVGPVNGGVKTIATVLNITRIHSAIHSVGSLQRCLSIARSYATVRTVSSGAKLLQDVPLHIAALADATLLYRALAHLTFGAVALLGRSECGIATPEEELRLRMLTPTVKAFAAEKAVSAMEECMAAMGGQGYMEETGIGRLIRDALVEKIWEGTINILSLDLLRAASGGPALEAFSKWSAGVIANFPPDAPLRALQPAIATLKSAIDSLPGLFEQGSNSLLPRQILLVFGHIACSMYLLEHAIWSYTAGEAGAETDAEAFRRWVKEGELSKALQAADTLSRSGSSRIDANAALVYGPRNLKSKM